MDKMTETQMTSFYNRICAKLSTEQLSSDEATQCAIDEAVHALALGCVLRRPRQFGADTMSAQDFIFIADNINAGRIMFVVRTVANNKSYINNRAWYILGLFVHSRNKQFAATTKAALPKKYAQQNFDERSYTANDFADIVTPICKLKDIAL
ncbi:MAG: hypothetical protein RR338_04670 [Clostridia bacterium]